MTESAVCPVCRTSAYRLLHGMPDTTTLQQCATCGFVIRDPMLSFDARKSRYSEPRYFSKTSSPEEGLYGYNNYLRDRHFFMWLFADRLEEIERLQPRGRLLDVGCGPGVDLSTFAVDVARRYYNLDVQEGDLQDIQFPDDHFDVVTMDDFIEHVPEPRDVMAEAVRILRPGGLFAMSTPNAASLTATLMGRHWFHYKQEEHCIFFTPDSLRRLCDDLGLEVISIRKSPRVVDLNYLFTRMAYYSERLSRVLLQVGRWFLTARVGFFIYTGEMRLLARKRHAA